MGRTRGDDDVHEDCTLLLGPGAELHALAAAIGEERIVRNWRRSVPLQLGRREAFLTPPRDSS